MADPSDPCATEIQAADTCILADVENCVCLEETFLETFPTEVESSFQAFLATQDPADPLFCQATNDNLCEFLQAAASCCCIREVTEYSACILAKDLVNKYETFKEANCSGGGSCVVDLTATDPESGSGPLSGTDTPDQETLIILCVAVTIVLCILSCLYYCCCYRKRVIKRKGKGIEVNIKCSNTGKTTDTTRTNQTFEREEKKTETTSRRQEKKRPPAPPPPEDSESSEDDFAWDDFNVTKRSERRDIESGHSREMNDSRSERLKVKRRSIEAWHEEEKRKRSTRSFQSYSSDEESRQKPKRKKKPKKKKEAPPKEVTVRKARTLVQEYEEEKEGGHTETIRVALIPDMKAVMELLEEEKSKLDIRTKAVEEEKMRLKMELKESQAKFNELQESREAKERGLSKAKLNKAIVRRGSQRYLLETETKRSEMEKDLKILQREREEMAALLDSLKQAEIHMNYRVKESEEVTNVLRMEKRDSERDLANLDITKAEEEELMRQAQTEVELLQKQTARESGEALGIDAAAMLELQAIDAHVEEEEMMAEMMESFAGLQADRRDLECQLVYAQSGDNASQASALTNPTFIGNNYHPYDNHDMMQPQFESNDLMQPTQYDDTMAMQPPHYEHRGMMNQQQYQYESHDMMQPNNSSKGMMTLLTPLDSSSESEESADYAHSHQHLRTSHAERNRRSMRSNMTRSSRSTMDPPAIDCTL